MNLREDDRAVTVQIGAVLLFGILIVALATFQVTVVPNENSAAEFEHNLDAQQGMSELRNALLGAAASSDPQSASLPLGTTYPQRTLFINPPPPRGTVRTDGTGDARVNVTLNNANVRSKYDNAEDYWNGTARTYDTGYIVYSPNYNEYREAPTTVYENSLVLNVFSENQTLERTGQTLIQGNSINLLTLNGSLQESGTDGESVDARPLSAYTNTVTVRSNASDPFWINITSRLHADTWGNRVLADQLSSNGGNVAEVVEISNRTRDGVTYHQVGIQLAEGSYELRGASVAVGAVSETDRQPDPTYFVVTDGYDTVGNGSTGNITVQVRDQFNNPVDDFEVNASITNNGGEEYLRLLDTDGNGQNNSVVTDKDGYATFTYKAVNETVASESASVNVSMLGGDETYRYKNFSERKVPTFTFGGEGDSSGGSEGLNPGGPGSVILTKSEIANDTKAPNVGSADADWVWLVFNKTGATNATITHTRINVLVYSSARDPPYTHGLLKNENNETRANMSISGSYATVSPTVNITPGKNSLFIEFIGDGENNNNIDLENGDWFVLTVIYEQNGKQRKAVYFVSPKHPQ